MQDAQRRIDLFTLLEDDSLDSEEIAERLKGDLRGVSMLLNALTVMGLLSRSDGKYTNTSAARSFLSRDSKQYLGHMIMHHHLVESWARLNQAVLSGERVRERPNFSPEEFLESFLLGMHTLAMLLAHRKG